MRHFSLVITSHSYARTPPPNGMDVITFVSLGASPSSTAAKGGMRAAGESIKGQAEEDAEEEREEECEEVDAEEAGPEPGGGGGGET